MGQANYKIKQVSKRYAASLLDVAKDKPGIESVEKDIRGLLELVKESSELKQMLIDPRIQLSDKKSVLTTVCERAGYNAVTAKFVSVLADNGRLDILSTVLDVVIECIEEMRGVVLAQVISANDMDKKQQDALTKTLVKTLGAQIRLDVSTDPSLLGGMVLQVGSMRIDDSVKNKLERLERQLIGGSTKIAA